MSIEGTNTQLTFEKTTETFRIERASSAGASEGQGQFSSVLNSVTESGLAEAREGKSGASLSVQQATGTSVETTFTDGVTGTQYGIAASEDRHTVMITNKETGDTTRIWGDPHIDIDNNGTTDADHVGNVTFMTDGGGKITLDTTDWKNSNGLTLVENVHISQGDFYAQISGVEGRETTGDLSVETNSNGYREDLAVYDGKVFYQSPAESNGWIDADSGKSMRDFGKAGLKEATSGQAEKLESDIDALLANPALDGMSLNKEQLQEDLAGLASMISDAGKAARSVAEQQGVSLGADFWRDLALNLQQALVEQDFSSHTFMGADGSPVDPAYRDAMEAGIDTFGDAWTSRGESMSELMKVLDVFGGDSSQIVESTGDNPPAAAPAPAPSETAGSEPITPDPSIREFDVKRDTEGATTFDFRDHENMHQRVVGDSDANTFHLGGKNNYFDIQNIGSDETINLHGEGWELDESSLNDGDPQGVRYINTQTGSEAYLQTDAGRSESFVRDKVQINSSGEPAPTSNSGAGGEVASEPFFLDDPFFYNHFGIDEDQWWLGETPEQAPEGTPE